MRMSGQRRSSSTIFCRPRIWPSIRRSRSKLDAFASASAEPPRGDAVFFVALGPALFLGIGRCSYPPDPMRQIMCSGGYEQQPPEAGPLRKRSGRAANFCRQPAQQNQNVTPSCSMRSSAGGSSATVIPHTGSSCSGTECQSRGASLAAFVCAVPQQQPRLFAFVFVVWVIPC